jgi:glycosyltransferase involved in cell wall biosynthesis
MESNTRYRVSLVVPCYNEAHRLNITAFREFLEENGTTRLLFVDDGSRDETFQVLEGLRGRHEWQVQVLRGGRNRGKAEAVRLGVMTALDHYEQDMIGYWDADLATPLDAVDDFLCILDRHPEVEMIFGARVKLLGRHVERRAARHYLGRIFATTVSTALNLAIYDTQCGAKLFRVTPELRQAFAEPFLSKWVFDVEIIARLLKLHGGDRKRMEQAIYEFPLQEWEDVRGSKVRPTDFFTAFWDVVRIYRKYLR